ncbi:MAG TPA: hypothetical protein VFI02_11885 [Armatimonadota bacterium]|nr:hypothetical protein [Armatimonadota bacterium]
MLRPETQAIQRRLHLSLERVSSQPLELMPGLAIFGQQGIEVFALGGRHGGFEASKLSLQVLDFH